MSDNFFKMVKALKDDAMLEQEDGNGNLQEYFSESRAALHLRENFVTIKTYELALSELDKLRDDLCRMRYGGNSTMDDELEYVFDLRVAVEYDRIFVTGDGFHQLEALGIDISRMWEIGFRGTIEIKGEMK